MFLSEVVFVIKSNKVFYLRLSDMLFDKVSEEEKLIFVFNLV